jgi:hypothetical protein
MNAATSEPAASVHVVDPFTAAERSALDLYYELHPIAVRFPPVTVHKASDQMQCVVNECHQRVRLHGDDSRALHNPHSRVCVKHYLHHQKSFHALRRLLHPYMALHKIGRPTNKSRAESAPSYPDEETMVEAMNSLLQRDQEYQRALALQNQSTLLASSDPLSSVSTHVGTPSPPPASLSGSAASLSQISAAASASSGSSKYT